MSSKFLLYLSILVYTSISFGKEAYVLVRGDTFDKDSWSQEPIYEFDSLKLPLSLSRNLIQTALQQFYNQKHKEAFIFMGDWRDFDHGHLLMEGDKLRAILFHTQERADIAPKNSHYSYIDKAKRTRPYSKIESIVTN